MNRAIDDHVWTVGRSKVTQRSSHSVSVRMGVICYVTELPLS